MITRTYLFAGAFVFIACVMVGLFVRGVLAIHALGAEARVQKDAIELAVRKDAIAAGMRKTLRVLLQENVSLDDYFVHEGEAVDVINTLEALGDKAHADVSTTSITVRQTVSTKKTKQDPDPLGYFDMLLSARGTYQALAEWLSLVETMPTTVMVRRVELVHGEEDWSVVVALAVPFIKNVTSTND